MRTLMWCLAAVMIGAPASRVLGQGGNGAAGYIALVSTPTAGVPPVAKQWMLADPAHGVGVETQWGHVSGNGGSLDTFVSGVTLPLAEGRADVGFSAGYVQPSCDQGDCAGYAVASGVVEGRVLQSQAGSASFVLGLSGRIGFAKPSDATAWSASAAPHSRSQWARRQEFSSFRSCPRASGGGTLPIRTTPNRARDSCWAVAWKSSAAIPGWDSPWERRRCSSMEGSSSLAPALPGRGADSRCECPSARRLDQFSRRPLVRAIPRSARSPGPPALLVSPGDSSPQSLPRR